MNNTKHTPGPWKVKRLPQECYGYIRAITVGDDHLAHVLDWEDSLTECTANARLIASAPELLEACKGILQSFHESIVTELALEEFPALKRVAEAIAKAEGRA